MKAWEDMTDAEKEAEGREVLAWIEYMPPPQQGGEQVVNIITGEVTEVPAGESWDNWMESRYS